MCSRHDLAIRTALKNHGVAYLTIPSDTQEGGVRRAHAPQCPAPHLRGLGDGSFPAELRRSPPGRRHPQRRPQGRHPGRPGGARRRRRTGASGRDAGRADRQAAARQGVRARTTARTRPAESACWAPRRPRTRWRSAIRLLIVGTSFPYMEFYPKPGQARAVQIDIDPDRIGLRYPVEVGLVGDTRATLQALLPLLSATRTAPSSRRPRTVCASGGS